MNIVLNLHNIGLKYKTDKATHHNFLNFYEKKFKDLRYDKINLLEIGFLKGNSIKTWLDYFENATIYCIDIIDVDFVHPRFKYTKISQEDENLMFLFEDNYFDIIIDDGSHMTSHQIKSLQLLWCKLKIFGYYIIEDLHTSFIKKYIDTEITTYDFLKNKNTPKILENVKNTICNLEIFNREKDLFTDSITSIFQKNE
jgi:hypothetical protein